MQPLLQKEGLERGNFPLVPPPESWSERKFLPADVARASCTLPLSLDITRFYMGCQDNIIMACNTYTREQNSGGRAKGFCHPKGEALGHLISIVI